MSRSGVACGPECVPSYVELKLGKTHRYIIFKISEDWKTIQVEKCGSNPDWAVFVQELPETDCRYAVYDFHYKMDEGERNKIIFISWAPENSRVKNKMIYASSREGLRLALTGLGSEIQATDFSEIDYVTILEKVSKVKSQNATS